MSDLAAMARALAFIEAHLQAQITLADVAEAVAYSLYHFCRSFKRATHYTPYDYLMRRRIAEAARALLDGAQKVTDIAFDYQFNNLETFSRAFRRVLGQSPSQWRQQGAAGYRQLLPALMPAHLEHIARCGPWRPAVLPEFALSLVGAMTLGDAAAAWAWLERELPGCNTARYAWICHSAEGGAACAYLAAVAAETLSEIPAGLVCKELPSLPYLRFTQRGAAGELELLRDYIDYIWLPQSDYRAALPCYLVHYAAIPGGDVEIYIPAARRES